MAFNFSKIYDKINWRNKPDKTTPIDATNLGKIDTALNVIDDRVVGLGKKANDVDEAISTLNSNLESFSTKIKNVTLNAVNGFEPTTIKTCKITSSGNVRSLIFNVQGIITANSLYTIGQLESDDYPIYSIYNVVVSQTTGTPILLLINTDGSISVYASKNIIGNEFMIRTAITYLVK